MIKGVIYILTNPSFPEYVKIGYADDIAKRLKELNRSECIFLMMRNLIVCLALSGNLLMLNKIFDEPHRIVL